jgi:alkylation response protein AidB-like acyl-CoA dehydrogenase
VNGRWPFASGSPHATYLHVLAMIVDENEQPVVSEETQQPQVVNAVMPREDVTYHDTWDGLGLRGTSSGDLEVADVFVPDQFVQRGPWIDPAYGDRPLYRFPFAMHGHAPHALGVARGAIDAFLELTQRPPKPGSKRQSTLGREQVHQIGVAKADAMVRAGRLFARDAIERTWENVQTRDEADFELRVQLFQSGVHAVRSARDAMQIVFDLSGTDGVFRGRKMETCFRDLSTAAQHVMYVETNYRAIGQYYLTRDRPDGPQIDDPPPHFGPLPAAEGAAQNG